MKHKPAFDHDIYRRASEAIAHGANTNSKRPQSFVFGVYPTHLTHGQGCYVWDTHGNRYIDFICGLGSSILGYGQEEVSDAIAKQAKRGATLSLGTELEVQVAERVKQLFPFIERVRFLKTGSDACSAAVRIARASTERSYVFSDGYHGWADEFTSLTPPAHGVVNYARCIFKLEEIDHQVEMNGRGCVAAIIVEPIITDNSQQRIEYLEQLRETANELGAKLIFDEVITGFRWPDFSVSRHYGITPDLICLGKAVANGMPLSIVGGKADIMESDYFVSSTFAGETLSLAAALKTMELLTTKFKLEHLWLKGQYFLDQFNSMGKDVIQLEGYPTRSKFVAEPLTKALFMQEACRAGILIGPSFFFNFAHIEIADEALNVFSDIVTRIKTGMVKLEGEMPQAPYAERVRGS